MNQTIKTLRNGIVYGAILFILVLIVGSVYNISSQQTLTTGAILGIAALLANGLIHRKFTKSTKVLQAIEITLQEAETVQIQTPANHTIDEHAVSGKLFLTDKRLVFVSYNQAQQDQKEYSWQLTKSHSFKFYPTIFNAGGEFIINLHDQQLVFEVDDIKSWKQPLLNIYRHSVVVQ